MYMSKQVILTGIRANNDLTIGNYFGAILPIIDMANKRSDEYQINLFVPDLHSFTTPIDHSLLASGPADDSTASPDQPQQDSWLPALEQTDWGPLRRSLFPVRIHGISFGWDRPAGRLGTSEPVWR